MSRKEPAAASIAVKPETSAAQSAPLPEIIHLGIDVHLRQHVVCRKTDAATVQPAQRMKPQELVAQGRVECAEQTAAAASQRSAGAAGAGAREA